MWRETRSARGTNIQSKYLYTRDETSFYFHMSPRGVSNYIRLCWNECFYVGFSSCCILNMPLKKNALVFVFQTKNILLQKPLRLKLKWRSVFAWLTMFETKFEHIGWLHVVAVDIVVCACVLCLVFTSAPSDNNNLLSMLYLVSVFRKISPDKIFFIKVTSGQV